MYGDMYEFLRGKMNKCECRRELHKIITKYVTLLFDHNAKYILCRQGCAAIHRRLHEEGLPLDLDGAEGEGPCADISAVFERKGGAAFVAPWLAMQSVKRFETLHDLEVTLEFDSHELSTCIDRCRTRPIKYFFVPAVCF